MAKKENLKTFVIQQSDIDKAINYHLDKGGKDHRHLADCLEREMFLQLLLGNYSSFCSSVGWLSKDIEYCC